MTNLQYAILKYMLSKPRTINQTIKHLNRFRTRKLKRPLVERSISVLEADNIIEELTKEELSAWRSTREITGVLTDFSGFYIATEEYGVELGEEIHEDNRRFYIPFLFSAFFTALSIAIAVLSLLLSLS